MENQNRGLGSAGTFSIDDFLSNKSQNASKKDIGKKLLEKMGWKGKGIGKNQQGIAEPIQVQLRPQKMGLGFGSYEEKTEQQLKQQIEELESKLEFKEPPKKKAKSKKTFMTADELTESAKYAQEDKPYEIVDMRGPESKKLSVEHMEWMMESEEKESGLYDLYHNVKLLADRSEELLINFSKSIEFQKQSKKKFQKQLLECQREQESILSRKKQIQRLKEALYLLQERFSLLSKENPRNHFVVLDIEHYSDIIQTLKEDLQREYLEYNMNNALASLMFPYLKSIYRSWNMFQDPHLGFDIWLNWKSLLMPTEEHESSYSILLHQTWLSPVSTCINSKWNPNEYQVLMDFINIWRPLLSHSVLNHLIYNIIFPKLQLQLSSVVSEPIYLWLLPWLQAYPVQDKSLWIPLIRQNLQSVLQKILIADYEKAISFITPWVSFFSRKELDLLLMKTIIPKLSQMMQYQFQINPKNQDLTQLKILFSWKDILSPQTLLDILETHFFHIWLHTLYKILSVDQKPSNYYDEVTLWFGKWKDTFKELFSLLPSIQNYFTIALNMMNYCLANDTVKGFANDFYAQPNPTGKASIMMTSQQPKTLKTKTTFKDTLEYFAAKHNLSILSTGKTTMDGKPLMKFGSVLIYIDDQIVYALEGHDFTPVSFEKLLKLQK